MWHSASIKEIYEKLYSGELGITELNAQERLVKFGPNLLQQKKKKSLVKLFFSQFNSFIIWILIAATIVSYFVAWYENEKPIDAIVILIILILNAIFGFVQEFKAEKSIEALRKLAAFKARVIRKGVLKKIDASNLVPGDIIILETGDKIPADVRLIEAARLEVDESSLTGESTPVKKEPKAVAGSAQLTERICMLYSGTVITGGRAKAIVVETGMKTEIGKIADLVLQAPEEETPLQHKLSQLGEFLGIITLIVCAVVFIVGLFRAEESLFQDPRQLLDSFMIAVSLAVAAIPEGLPAVVTVCLALGVQRMVKKNALVRVLRSVETLGSTNVICTDKTGTLTYNQMTVREIYANNMVIDVTGHGYSQKGFFEYRGRRIDARPLHHLLKIGALCNDSKVNNVNGRWTVFGDPTEGALVVVAAKAGFLQESLRKTRPRIDELPFDSARKLMTTIHKKDDRKYAYVKGAPDVIIDKCNRILVDGKIRKLTTKDRNSVLENNLKMANKALRVLGFAYKEQKGGDIESNLIFTGLMGMIDPPRQEVRDSIRKCKGAGIKVVMITGDHRATAVAIARELGLEVEEVLTGSELDRIDDLSQRVDQITVYARVSPEHKMRIVNALKSKRHIVAMTGDGVNDAPALKRADIGISMGIAGTDVAKEASDMILTDDNFASIVNAVEEGRGIFDNIKKFVKYLLSSNLGEILTVFVAMLIGYVSPETGKVILPLVPIQLLWINLLTDGLPALALGLEPTDPDLMKQPPRRAKDKIIPKGSIIDMIPIGVIMMAGTLFVFHYSLPKGALYAGTMAFTTIVLFQLFNVLNCKNERKSLFRTGIFDNKWLLYAILSSLLLQVLVIYTPLAGYMKTMALSVGDWLIVLAISSTVMIFDEIRKLIVHGRT